ncbi:unnamed protein product, partial [Ectocarpus sp. 12 AP-2014]
GTFAGGQRPRRADSPGETSIFLGWVLYVARLLLAVVSAIAVCTKHTPVHEHAQETNTYCFALVRFLLRFLSSVWAPQHRPLTWVLDYGCWLRVFSCDQGCGLLGSLARVLYLSSGRRRKLPYIQNGPADTKRQYRVEVQSLILGRKAGRSRLFS